MIAIQPPDLPTEDPPSPAPDRTVHLDRDGRVELPAALVRSLRLFRTEPFIAIPGGRSWIHLVRADAGPPALAKTERIALLGELEEIGIADVFSMLNMARQTGMLLILEETGYKAAHFRRGEITFAESSRAEDRLGQVLYRTGKLSAEGLRTAEANLVPGRRFGAILLDLALLSPSDLQWGVRYQIEEIIYSMFRLAQGRFVFLRGTFVAPDLATLTIDTNGVLMEAYQRVDELGLITAHIRGRETILRPTGAEPPAGTLPERLQRAYSSVDGKRRVEEIVRALGWGEFNTFKVLYELVKRGLIEADGSHRPADAVSEDPRLAELRALVDSYNRAFLLIRDVLRAKRVAVDLPSVLESFVRSALEPTRSVLHGASLRSARRFTAETLLETIQAYLAAESGGDGAERSGDGTEGDRVRQLLVRALDEWIAHLRLVAFNLLPEGEAEELAGYVLATVRGLEG